MPSMMIHLLTAYKLKPDAPAEWWVGNVSPDAGQMTREEKDKSHLRDLSDIDRIAKLRELSNAASDLYSEGRVLHLYADYHWDKKAITRYYDYDSDFGNYRAEIAVASAWLFYTESWSGDVWNKMIGYDKLTDDEKAFITRNHKWHSDNYTGPPTFFTPDYINEFTDFLAEHYIKFKKGLI